MRSDGWPGEQAVKILIVEPDLSMADLLEKSLARFGFEVVTASTAEEGLAAAQQEAPDAIISALFAPEMDGLELCDRLREDAALCPVPILLLSDRNDTELRISAFRHGADAFLTKPVLLRELVTRLEQLLSRTSGGRTHSALMGNLSAIPLVEILQFLHVNRKSGLLRVFDRQHQGEIAIDRGDIRWARLGDRFAEEAIHQMGGWRSGRFEFEARDIATETNVSTPTMKLILECCAFLDQGHPTPRDEGSDPEEAWGVPGLLSPL